MDEAETIRAAMSLIGKRKSERKAASSAANAAKATAARAPGKPCDCGRTDGTHRWNCPAYRRAAARKHYAKQHRADQ